MKRLAAAASVLALSGALALPATATIAQTTATVVHMAGGDGNSGSDAFYHG